VEATWHVEDEQVFGHVRDPYHRLDIHPTSRLVRISLEGELLAESQRAQGRSRQGSRRAGISRERTSAQSSSEARR
jgi:uncharacterized protein (DUF427 family)